MTASGTDGEDTVAVPPPGAAGEGTVAVSPPGAAGEEAVAVPARQRSPAFKVLLVTLAVVFFVVFTALGTWQVKRRTWKLDLIARVEQRVHAAAAPAPGPAEWAQVTAATDEYRHVTATGTFLDASQTLVQAVTDLGAGYWVLTPLREADGSVVLVNRGFVAADDRNRVQPANAPTSTVTGLLRMTEPKGAFLRHNDPAANQWYSRDVQAIAAARGLSHVAPYFIDAHATPPNARVDDPTRPTSSASLHKPAAPEPNPPPTAGRQTSAAVSAPSSELTPPAPNPHGAAVAPTPGLTVIHFHNSHLVYAITWYTLALMTAIAIPLGMRKQ